MNKELDIIKQALIDKNTRIKKLEKINDLICEHNKGTYYSYNSYGDVVDIIEIDDELKEASNIIKSMINEKI